ncbi:hypothetical protein D9615_008976 [Tricholomella constricta]|uniref:Reverse transcriptase domain-containing protein n=1 Tax=Tricholomella constricta TaxID=117010 RepID=A0A8H5H0V2_9AGAR|nr:hypothetical protein D9615_008976 [Tricholomella constricta]
MQSALPPRDLPFGGADLPGRRLPSSPLSLSPHLCLSLPRQHAKPDVTTPPFAPVHPLLTTAPLPDLPPLLPTLDDEPLGEIVSADSAALLASRASLSPDHPVHLTSIPDETVAADARPTPFYADTPASAPLPSTSRQPPTRRASRRGVQDDASLDEPSMRASRRAPEPEPPADESSAAPVASKGKRKGKEREVDVDGLLDDRLGASGPDLPFGLETPPSSLRGSIREEAFRAYRNAGSLATQLQELKQTVATLSADSASRHRDVMRAVTDATASRVALDARAFSSSLTNNTVFRNFYDAVYGYKSDLDALGRAVTDVRHDVSSLRSAARDMAPPPAPPAPLTVYQLPPLPPSHPVTPAPPAVQPFSAPAPAAPGPSAVQLPSMPQSYSAPPLQSYTAPPPPAPVPSAFPPPAAPQRFSAPPPPAPAAPGPSSAPFDARRTQGSLPSRRNKAPGPATKKPRLEVDRSRDVLVSSVSQQTGAWDIAQRLVGNVPGFHSGNVYTCYRLDDRPDTISIRFNNRPLAERFVSVMATMDPEGLGRLPVSLADPTGSTAAVSGDDLAFITGSGSRGGPRGLRIGAWNIHGNLALKLLESDVLTFVRECDVFLFIETWLRPAQHEVLAIPDGYQIHSSARPAYPDLRPQRGGVAALLRSSLPAHVKESLCAPDVIAIELPDCLILGIYIPPSGSNWPAWSSVDPEDCCFGLIDLAHRTTSKPVLVLGDFNARTASRQVGSPHSPVRQSLDEVTNARGMRLLSILHAHSLVILNGTAYEHPRPGAYTSFQPIGSSVVDYALVSQALLPCLPSAALRVVDTEWSDHAHLRLEVNFPSIASCVLPSPNPPSTRKALLALGHDDTSGDSHQLNLELRHVLASARTDEEATNDLYGPVTALTTPLTVYIATTCRRQHGVPPTAAFGIFFGPKNRHNVGYRISGPQTDVTSPHSSLYIYTPSQTVIRTIAYWASRFQSQGWDCPNGDLYSVIVAFLIARAAPVSLRWVPSSSDNPHYREARTLAVTHCQRLPTVAPYLPPPAPMLPPLAVTADDSALHQLPKVTTPLPVTPPLPPSKQICFPALHVDFDDESHRGRHREREAKMVNLRRLKACPTSRQFWNLIREWTDPKSRPPQVTAQQLHTVFRARINPPPVPSSTFDADAYAQTLAFYRFIPPTTLDRTPEGFFSLPISLGELQWAQRKLARDNLRSACGADNVSYTTIARIPNGDLLSLLQHCIDLRRAPGPWLYTVLVGVLKRRRNPANPNDYRLIGLESCMLKLLTLLIDKRLRDWAEAYHILPDTQNGFRPHYRTNNNSFILRCAIERARASGKSVYIAFIDLENAFPSTDIPLLWTKLYRKGVAGPIFDWLRTLYADMNYILHLPSCLLTGDTASPSLWNIYFSDLSIPDHVDDVRLHGRAVSHVEQADDVVLFTTSPHGLQFKVDCLSDWCSVSRLIISADKSRWSIAKASQRSQPHVTTPITIAGAPIKFVTEYTYVGVTFDFATSSMFKRHCTTKASAASGISGATFTLDSFVGTVPPSDGRQLYMARVDPHLIHGCEVILDVDRAALNELEKVQRTFIRRLLHLSARSLLHPLYTETGLMPIKYRRIILAVGYLNSIFRLAPNCLPYLALMDSINLAQTHPGDRQPSWVKDLVKVCGDLPEPVHVNVDDLPACAPALSALIECLARNTLQASWDDSTKLLFRARGHDVTRRRLQPYLKLPDPRHRHAITQLLLSDHPLAVEQLRRQRWTGGRIERWQRLCRFCRTAIEDEIHALFGCRSSERLLLARDEYLATLFTQSPDLRNMFRFSPATAFVDFLVNHAETLPSFAAYVHEVFHIYNDVPMFLVT